MVWEVEAQLKEHIEIKWSNTLDTIVGLKVEKVNCHHYTLSQPFLTEKILMDNADLLTPLLATSPLTVGTTLETDTALVPMEPGRFLSIIGSLSYLAVGTRPDLAYAVNFLARYASTPQKEHWSSWKHLLRFVRNTAKFGLTVNPASQRFKKPIETFVDANWGGEFARSTYGHACNKTVQSADSLVLKETDVPGYVHLSCGVYGDWSRVLRLGLATFSDQQNTTVYNLTTLAWGQYFFSSCVFRQRLQ